MSSKCAILGILLSLSLVRGENFLTKNQCDRKGSHPGSIPEDCRCPPHFALVASDQICVMLTEPRGWSGELCRATGTEVDFYHLGIGVKLAVRELVLHKTNDDIWISVKSDGRYGLARSMLAGKSWGSKPDPSVMQLADSGRTGDCVKVNVKGISAEWKFADCEESHPQLCIYWPNNTLTRMYCEDPEEVTTRYSLYQDTCFKIVSNNFNSTNLTRFVPDSDRKKEINNMLNALANCSTNNLPNSNVTSTCLVYQKQLPKFIQPKLNLNYDNVLQKLLLSITDSRFLWRQSPLEYGFTCFVGEDMQLVKIQQKLWPPPNVTAFNDAEIYELSVETVFPKQYWCEGFAVPNFTRIESQKVVAQQKDPKLHVFAFWMTVSDGTRANIFSKIKRHLNESTMKTLNQTIELDLVRIEPNEGSKVKVILHVAASNGTTKLENISGIPLELLDGIGDHYRMKRLLETSFKAASNDSFTFLSINSTEMCFPEPANHNGTWWSKASIGETVTVHGNGLCVLNTGLPPHRKCLGDRINGGSWESAAKLGQCISTVKEQTETLYSYYTNSSILRVNEIEGALEGINKVITNYSKKMIPIDIHYVSGTLEHFRKTLLDNGTNNAAVIANKGPTFCCGLAGTLSRMMDVEESALKKSQSQLNATNRLLDATEDIINQLSTTESLFVGEDRNCPNAVISPERGTMLIRKPKFALLVADPAKENITGMALVRKPNSDDFLSYDTEYLTMDQTEKNILAMEHLEIASFIPRSLVDKMKQLRAKSNSSAVQFRVVIAVYYNDRVFLESLGKNSRRTNGKIISVTVPKYGSKLPEMLPIFVREEKPSESSSCEFWDFVPQDGDKSQWSSDGCEMIQRQDNVSLCKCYHMTSFSRIFLSSASAQKLIDDHPQSAAALDIFTTVGCVLSLVGIVGIFLTAIIFPRWCNVFNSKILLHLSLAVAMQFIIFMVVDHFKSSDDLWCLVQGASLHYLILVTFMWMLVIAYLQFMQFVKVLGKLRPTHCVLKASILSWGLPLAPVGYFAYTNKYNYLRSLTGSVTDICHPHNDAQSYGLFIPIALILTVNVACLMLIMYNVVFSPDKLPRSTNKSMAMLQLRLFFLLFFQLGLPWIFGMMAGGNDQIAWQYLFCITAPYQGFMLFLNFILLQPSTRRLWTKKFTEIISNDKFASKKSSTTSQVPIWL